ncbi:hypothetical protein D3C77_638440 [compost metagenome]
MFEHVVGRRALQRRRGNLVVVTPKKVLLQGGPIAFGVSTSGDNHFVGADRAIGGFHPPAAVFAFQALDSGLLKNLPT